VAAHRPWKTTNNGEGTLADTKNRKRMAASSGNVIDEGRCGSRATASDNLLSVLSM
jgi:hypothetical protein